MSEYQGFMAGTDKGRMGSFLTEKIMKTSVSTFDLITHSVATATQTGKIIRIECEEKQVKRERHPVFLECVI